MTMDSIISFIFHCDAGHPFSAAKLEAGTKCQIKTRWSLLRREFVLLSAIASLVMPENRKDRPPDEPKG